MTSPYKRKALFIGSVWPEPRSSAAGVRTLGILHSFLKEEIEVHFWSPSASSPHRKELQLLDVQTREAPLNDSRVDSWLRELQPDWVIFDRFIIEEQFGWRVSELCPDSIRILDTQDLHFLRRARGGCGKKDDTLRELASIYRSDLSLIISDFEFALLREEYQVPERLLQLLRFSYLKPHAESLPSFSERKGYAWIGNFRHPPNHESVFNLVNQVWPLIRSTQPDAQVHIYGAYPPKEISKLHAPNKGVHIEGWTENSIRSLSQHRVNLVPLQFGAGIKGKITDGWAAGTPNVTTPIGAEGMSQSGHWGGLIARDTNTFARSATQLYNDSILWAQKQKTGFNILQSEYDIEQNHRSLWGRLRFLERQLKTQRELNWCGQILQHQTLRSTKYFSKWIEAKNLPATEQPRSPLFQPPSV